jgi:hypothetical protein
LATAAIAAAADPTAAELRQQIEAMQAQINKIEAKAAASDQTQKTIENVLGDAERRSQLLQSGGLTAGYDKGFFLASADGNFRLQPFFQFQFRSVTNYGEDAQDDGDDNLESGFEIRRAKFGIQGNAFSKDLKYQLRWASARSGGDLILENAFISYEFADNIGFRVGQWKDNTFHEEYVSSGRQLAVDRSLVNELLAGGQTDYVQGVALTYGGSDTPIRGEIAYIDGANTDNTDYTDGGGGPNIPDIDPSFGVSARPSTRCSATGRRTKTSAR